MDVKLFFGIPLLLSALFAFATIILAVDSGKIGMKFSYVLRIEEPVHFKVIIWILAASSIIAFFWSGTAILEVISNKEIFSFHTKNERYAACFLIAPCMLNTLYLFTRRFDSFISSLFD